MLTINDKIYLLLSYRPKGFNSFKNFVERRYKYPYHVLSNNNLSEAISAYCQMENLCENCLDKPLCECKRNI